MPAGTLRRAVSEIVRAEGFRVAGAKTSVRRRHEAILHDAEHSGPDAANRAGCADFHAHLLGRIAWVGTVNPARGRRLREHLARVAW